MLVYAWRLRRSSGKFAGRAELTVELVSITVNGKMIPVITSSVSEYSGVPQGASTAKKAAAVGALSGDYRYGATAGGGKGAAIGAGAERRRGLALVCS